MISVQIIFVLGVVLAGVLAEPPGSFTAGAVIRFPTDDSPPDGQQHNAVQGLRYFATGPNSAQRFAQLYPGSAAAHRQSAQPYFAQTHNGQPQFAQTHNGQPQFAQTHNAQPQFAQSHNAQPQFAQTHNAQSQFAQTHNAQPHFAQIYDMQADNQGSATNYDVHEHQPDHKLDQNHPELTFSSLANFQNAAPHKPAAPPPHFAYPPRYPIGHPKDYPQLGQSAYSHSPKYTSPLNGYASNHQPYPRYVTPASMQTYPYGAPQETGVAYRPRKPSYAQRPNAPKYRPGKDGAAIYGTPWGGGLRGQGQGQTMPNGTPFNPEVYNTITEQMLGLRGHNQRSGVEHSLKSLQTQRRPGQDVVQGDKVFRQEPENAKQSADLSYNGLRPAVSVYHKSQQPQPRPQPHHVVPTDLAGGRSAGGGIGESSWLPINAPADAVPARAVLLAAPDLTRRDAAPDAFTLRHDVSRAGFSFPEMTERRVGHSGNSEEVVSAVVLVKQK